MHGRERLPNNNNNNNNDNNNNNNNKNSGSIYTGSVLLMEAILRRRTDVVDYLISNAPQLCLNLNSKDKTGSNILFYAASVGGVGDIDKLIQAGCQVESDYEGRTVLMQAALSARVDTARFLVLSSRDIGLDIEQKDNLGRNALFYGVESNSLEMVEYLFSVGIACNPTEGNTTVLMQSARSGNDVITRFLLEHSGQLNMGDINMMDFRGETALFYAIQSCSTSVVAMLIENGADPLVKNSDGVSAISYSMNNASHLVAVSILECAVPLDADVMEEAGMVQTVKGHRSPKVDKNQEEKIDSKRQCDSASDEFPARNQHGRPSPSAANLSAHDCNKTLACYDSDVSSRCSSSSSSGVCSRSTCSLYNSFNKSNCSNDESCGCVDEMNNNNIGIAANTSCFNNDEQLSDKSAEIDRCEVCNQQENSLQSSNNLVNSFSPHKSRMKNANVEDCERETTCHNSPEFQTQDLNTDSYTKVCTSNHADSSSTPDRIRLLKSLLWSKDNRNRSLIQYLIEAGETRLIMTCFDVLEEDELCKQNLQSEIDETGCSLLMSACKQPLQEFANKSKIKDRSVKMNDTKLKRKDGTQSNRLDLVKYLVEVIRVDPQGVDMSNRNALFYTVESGSLQVTSYLLQKMKTVEADKTGRTILMIAVASGNQLVVSEILASKFAAGLLVARDEGGRTAFHFCAMQDCSVHSAVMLDTLLKYEESLRIERHVFPKANDRNLIVPERPNFPDSPDYEGRTPLMYACQSGNRSAVMRLLRNPRVLPDRRDVRGRTALHHCFAGTNASLFCAGSLLRRNVDVNATDVDGVTCLMLACHNCSVTNIPVIRMLVEFGADSVLQDTQGKDSFDYCPPLNSHYVRAILKEKTCMPTSEREALWQMEQRLGDELHMNSVLRGLLKEGIFTKTLNFEVMKQPPAERIQKLLEILVTRGRSAFRKFCLVLRKEGEFHAAFELMKLAYVKESELFW